MKRLSIALFLLSLSACSTTKTEFVAARSPLTPELAREPASCAPLIDAATLRDLATWASCQKAAATLNGEHVKALQGLWEK